MTLCAAPTSNSAYKSIKKHVTRETASRCKKKKVACMFKLFALVCQRNQSHQGLPANTKKQQGHSIARKKRKKHCRTQEENKMAITLSLSPCGLTASIDFLCQASHSLAQSIHLFSLHFCIQEKIARTSINVSLSSGQLQGVDGAEQRRKIKKSNDELHVEM